MKELIYKDLAMMHRYSLYYKHLLDKLDPVFRVKIIAIVVYKGMTIATERNENKTHPLQYKYSNGLKPYKHAELSAMLKASKLLNKKTLDNCQLIVLRHDKGNKLRTSKPCSSCWRLIRKFKIRYVTYYDEQMFITKELIYD